MRPPILQPAIPADQLAAAAQRLPQMQPVLPGDWLRRDGANTAQLEEKARLIALDRALVLRVMPGAEAACAELLDLVLEELPAGFHRAGGRIERPDGESVTIDRGDPLLTLSQLVQEDLCIHKKIGAEHVLTAALLCFPAAWTLAEKIGQPLTRIHAPVPVYDSGIAARVQRMFDMVRADRPLWRANLLRYDDPSLFQPHAESAPRPVGTATSPYLRSERQTIRRLPLTDAVVFTIHTSMCRAQDPGPDSVGEGQ